MTIIARVQKALEGSGNKPLADELIVFMHKLVGNVNQYMALHDQLRRTTREYIYTVQSRCKHNVWIVCHSNVEGDPSTWGPTDSISCVGCGHTVCDEAAANWGRKVVQDQKWLYHVGGRRFQLSAPIKQRLGDKLVVKEMDNGDEKAPGPTEAHQEGPRAAILPSAGPPVGTAGDRQDERRDDAGVPQS